MTRIDYMDSIEIYAAHYGDNADAIRERAPKISGSAAIFWTANYCRSPVTAYCTFKARGDCVEK